MSKFYDPKAGRLAAATEPKDDMQAFVDEHRAPVIERAKRLNTMNQDYFRNTLTDAEYQRRFGED